MDNPEIYFGAVNLSPYFVRQDNSRFVFRGVPPNIQFMFDSDVFIAQAAYIGKSGYRPLGGTVFKYGHFSLRIEFPNWYWIGGGSIAFYFINSDDDYGYYLLRNKDYKEKFQSIWRNREWDGES